MSQITEVIHTNTQATKAEIFEHLTPNQKKKIIFYHKDGITWQDLDPRQNRYNSVRFQYLKCSGHFIKEEIQIWHCHQEGCEFFCSTPTAHYFTFGDSPRKPSSSPIRHDDITIIGESGHSKHLLTAHSDWAQKRLGQLGLR